jgi:hypothetical protein
MPFNEIPRRGLSPLWIIAVFVSFSETVLGVAVIQTKGGIQVSLTTFVIVFPAIVCGLFFWVLWKRPYVFYTPADFGGDVGVREYVEAMHYQREAQSGAPISEVAIKSIETKLKTLFAGALSEVADPKQKEALLLRETVDAVRQSVIQIDSRPFFGEKGRVWEESFDPSRQMDDFLNTLYFEMRPLGLPIFSYGKVWALRDPSTEKVFVPAGSQWARLNGAEDDDRTLSEVGLTGGMKLDVLRIGRTRSKQIIP